MKAIDAPTQVDALKVDPYGIPVPGAKLQVLDKTGAVIDEWVSTEEAHRIYQLHIGETYTLHEKEAPEGYLPAEDVSRRCTPLPPSTTTMLHSPPALLSSWIRSITRIWFLAAVTRSTPR